MALKNLISVYDDSSLLLTGNISTFYLGTSPVLTADGMFDVITNNGSTPETIRFSGETIQRLSDNKYVLWEDDILINFSSVNFVGDGSTVDPFDVSGEIVRSVVLATPDIIYSDPVNFTTSGGTATGTLALNTQAANTFLRGPVTGANATPFFGQLEGEDIPISTGLSNTAGLITNNVSTGIASSDQSIVGSTLASGSLTLFSTLNATKGKIYMGNSAYNESLNFFGIGTNSPSARLTISGNVSAAAWGPNGIGLSVTSASYTDTSSSGPVVNNAISTFAIPTLLATNDTTYTTAATLRISGAPVASSAGGGTVAITTACALLVSGGLTFLNGLTSVVGGIDNGYGIGSNIVVPGANNSAPTNASGLVFSGAPNVNYHAAFNGNGATLLGISNSAANVIIGKVPVTTASSGTHAVLANLVVNPVGAITSGGATITKTASLYINDVSAGGASNYALYSAVGSNYLGGNLIMGGSTSGAITIGTQPTAGTYNFNLPTTAGSAGQVLTSGGGASNPMTWSSVPIICAAADLLAQTSVGVITSFTVGTQQMFLIGAYLNVTAIATNVIQIQVTYTDINSTPQTVNFANISTVSNSDYSSISIYAKTGTSITVKTNLSTSGGSVTFNAGARIIQI